MPHTLKVVLLVDKAITPKYAHESDSGLDLYSIENCVIPSGESKLVRTGIAIQLPEGTEGQVRPRSGLALKYQITVLNTPGTIDQGYTGEICVILINHGEQSFEVTSGMKIAQLVISPLIKVKVETVSSVDNSDRGSAGFGSTGF